MKDITCEVDSRLVKKINTECALSSLLYSNGFNLWHPAPLSLFPSSITNYNFQKLKYLQPFWNDLIDKISRDKRFLIKNLRKISKVDSFTYNLLKILKNLSPSKLDKTIHLGIFRNDYMLHQEENDKGICETPLQVEINTVSSSFGSLSSKINAFHQSFLHKNKDNKAFQALTTSYSITNSEILSDLSEDIEKNNSLEEIAYGLSLAHFYYLKKFEKTDEEKEKVLILVIVQENEKNQADQRLLEKEIISIYGITCEFLTFKEVKEFSRPTETQLFLDIYGQEFEVSTVYFRAGYTPDDYFDNSDWNLRERIENCESVIKCPSVGMQLAGSKAIQALLTNPGILESFLLNQNEEDVEEEDDEEFEIKNLAPLTASSYSSTLYSTEILSILKTTFCQQFNLGDKNTKKESEELINKLINEPKECDKWVLKPQREGGGNNYYGESINAFFKENYGKNNLLDGFVLMQRIFPKLDHSLFCQRGGEKFIVTDSISELGIYGILLSDGSLTSSLSKGANEIYKKNINTFYNTEDIISLNSINEKLKKYEHIFASQDKNNKEVKKENKYDLNQIFNSLNNLPTTSNFSPLNELFNNERLVYNNITGYLLRTKDSSNDEGGIASGYSVLNTIILKD